MKREIQPQVTEALIAASRRLREEVERFNFAPPVECVYNPLLYAWAPYETYLRRFAQGPKRVVFLGMNPGPFGMVQTGVPFGEVTAIRDWMRVSGPVSKPTCEHPRRLVTGFACRRAEVSGRRLWGLFAERFGDCDRFFEEHLVLNYCPLAFLESSGRNITPDKLPRTEKEQLFKACDGHLRAAVALLRPEWVVGIGDFAFKRAQRMFDAPPPKVGQVLHPSPANPAANRGWAAVATRQLEESGVWRRKGNP